jgi:hypothetical protein
MNRDEIQKLLGGYATGTLTAEEQELLFAAALEDQELFDALAREQSLRDLLRDPAARAHVLASMGAKRSPWYGWLLRPAAVTAMTAIVLAVGLLSWRATRKPKPVMVAMQTAPAPAPVPQATPATVPEIKTTMEPVTDTALQPPSRKETPRDEPEVKRPADAVGSLNKVQAAPPAAPAPTPALAQSANGALVINGSVSGAVTDPAGAAISGAQVQAVLSGGSRPFPATTDAQGRYSIAGLENGKYKITAQAAGFQSALLDNVTLDGSLKNVDLRLGVGAAAETLEVTAQSAQQLYNLTPKDVRFSAPQPANSAVPAARMAMQAAKPQAPYLGVKWTLWRKQADSTFAQVEPDAIQAGDTVKLRLEPNDDGFLAVSDGGIALLSMRVTAHKPVETPEIKSDKPGVRELGVVLSRSAGLGGGGGGSGRMGILPVASQQSSADKKENYAVNPSANPSAPFSLKISLNFK